MAYPMIVAGSVWGNLSLMEAERGVLVSTYLPVTLGTLLVIWLEVQMPYRVLWKPSRKEVAEDSAFLALVHVLWPKLLSVGIAFSLFDLWNAREWPTYAIRPREWRIPMQALLMALMVDSTRYWLHRISHEWKPPDERARAASVAPCGGGAGVQYQLWQPSHPLGLAVWDTVLACRSGSRIAGFGKPPVPNRFPGPNDGPV